MAKRMSPLTKKTRKQRIKVEIEVIDGLAYVIECPDEVSVKITYSKDNL